MNDNHDWMNQDLYRILKVEQLKILDRYNITYDITERADQIRKKVKTLKESLKLAKQNAELRPVVYQILLGKKILTPEQETQYPILVKLQKITKEEDEYKLGHTWFNTLFDHYKLNSEDSDIQSDQSDLESDVTKNTLEKPQHSRPPTTTPENSDREQNVGQHLNIKTIMPENYEKLPLISAGSFNGLPSENPNDFIDKFTMAADSNRWTDETKLRLFPTHLTGTALAWFKRYKQKQLNEEIRDWEDLKTQFINTFTPLAQSQSLQLILENKFQGPQESTLSYFLDVLTTCKRYEPNITDDRVIQYIIQGLQPNICDQVIAKDNTTLDNLEKNLQEVEKCLLTQRSNREKYNRLHRNQTPNDTAYKMFDNIKENIDSLARSLNNMNTQNPYTSAPQNSQYNTYNQKGDDVNTGHTRQNQHQTRYGATFEPQLNKNTAPNISSGQPNHQFIHRNQTPFGKPGNKLQRQPFNQHQRFYCNVCKKTNHNTENCWFKNKPSNQNNSHVSGKHVPPVTFTNNNTKSLFCSYCKRTNHNIQNCFRSKYYKGNH